MALQADITESRIKNMLIMDKMESPASFKQTLKLELYGLLSQFLQLKPEDVKLAIEVLPTGRYKLSLVCLAEDINRKIGIK